MNGSSRNNPSRDILIKGHYFLFFTNGKARFDAAQDDFPSLRQSVSSYHLEKKTPDFPRPYVKTVGLEAYTFLVMGF